MRQFSGKAGELKRDILNAVHPDLIMVEFQEVGICKSSYPVNQVKGF
ncbi:hypothetical protein KRR40_19480 [Niabella defluvii]|nr:hypothetical protein KRR40_19480 [Niabella sp. I65]